MPRKPCESGMFTRKPLPNDVVPGWAVRGVPEHRVKAEAAGVPGRAWTSRDLVELLALLNFVSLPSKRTVRRISTC